MKHRALSILKILCSNIFNPEFRSYCDINPLRFQKGDIVEMTVSFFCVQTRMNKYKMITSLKSIVLLDDTIREVCFTLKFHDLCLYDNICSLFSFFIYTILFAEGAKR
jgi:hypothetical protein